MPIQNLTQDELNSVSGGPLPVLVGLAVKAFSAGATVAAVVLAVEDLSGAEGHNHYGK